MNNIYVRHKVTLLPEHEFGRAIASVVHSPSAIEAAKEAEEEGLDPIHRLSESDLKALMTLFGFKGTPEEFKSGHYEPSSEEKRQLERLEAHERAARKLMEESEQHRQAKPKPVDKPPIPLSQFFGVLKASLPENTSSDT